MNGQSISPIARMHSDFPAKFGIPRQSGIVRQLQSTVVFEGEYLNPEALRWLEGFSHIWLIWGFSENLGQDWSPTVRPPRLGGNRRMGVFATRSPFRPNSLGLSCVRLVSIEERAGLGTVLVVAGADLMDGTPIYDIKPYIPYADCVPDALSGFAPDAGARLHIEFLPGTEERVPDAKLTALKGVIENDPRPRYQHDAERVYGLEFSGMDIKFTVEGNPQGEQNIKK